MALTILGEKDISFTFVIVLGFVFLFLFLFFVNISIQQSVFSSPMFVAVSIVGFSIHREPYFNFCSSNICMMGPSAVGSRFSNMITATGAQPSCTSEFNYKKETIG